MKIVVLGAGQVGSSVAHALSREDNDITIVDIDAAQLKELQDRLDIRAVNGFASHPRVLERASKVPVASKAMATKLLEDLARNWSNSSDRAASSALYNRYCRWGRDRTRARDSLAKLSRLSWYSRCAVNRVSAMHTAAATVTLNRLNCLAIVIFLCPGFTEALHPGW